MNSCRILSRSLLAWTAPASLQRAEGASGVSARVARDVEFALGVGGEAVFAGLFM
jgi:hypothetical protein